MKALYPKSTILIQEKSYESKSDSFDSKEIKVPIKKEKKKNISNFFENASSRQSIVNIKNSAAFFIQNIIQNTKLPKLTENIFIISAIQFSFFFLITITLVILVNTEINHKFKNKVKNILYSTNIPDSMNSELNSQNIKYIYEILQLKQKNPLLEACLQNMLQISYEKIKKFKSEYDSEVHDTTFKKRQFDFSYMFKNKSFLFNNNLIEFSKFYSQICYINLIQKNFSYDR